MSVDHMLSQGVMESIHATTPGRRTPRKRNPLPAALGWAAVVLLSLFVLAAASVSGA